MRFFIRDLLLLAQEQHPAPLSQLAWFGVILGVIIVAALAAVVVASQIRSRVPNTSAPAPRPPKP
ncbi:MAG: hypothetical protein IAF94_19140 [Pirellulaceae bacterium]|nr:hypothetical protein [Pirellulaceae bacterium]